MSTTNYVVIAIVTLLTLGYFRVIPVLAFPVRAILYVVLLVTAAFLGFLEGMVLKPFGSEGIVQWITARTFYNLCKVFFLGIQVVIEDPDNLLRDTRPAVFISNHQSMFDILLLGATFPKWCSVTAKKALKYYPFLGWFMAVSKTVFIDRARRDDALKAFSNARNEVLKDKQSIFMFPEGTRSYFDNPDMLPFKKGAFHFAQQAGVPIVPYVVCNYSNVWSWKRQVAVPCVIKVKVLPAIDTANLKPEDVGKLSEKVRDDMLKVANELGYATKVTK